MIMKEPRLKMTENEKFMVNALGTEIGDNRLNVADSNIQTSITNSQAAVSAIFDLDIPEEMVELSQSEMMEQSSIEVLSREMRSKQNLLKLF